MKSPEFVNNRFPTQKWPRGKRLTFDINGEIIIFVERLAVFPPVPALFSPSFRIHTSFIHIVRKSVFSQLWRGFKS